VPCLRLQRSFLDARTYPAWGNLAQDAIAKHGGRVRYLRMDWCSGQADDRGIADSLGMAVP
jgi:hypothetical protein